MSSKDIGGQGTSGNARAGDVLDMRILTELRELGGEEDPGLIAELIDIFLSDAPQRLQDISKGLATGDLQIVERAAHTLKSSSANIGAIGLSRICREMEQIAREKKLDAIQPLLVRSKQAMSEVQSALEALKP
jgi:HPt (histidine-containing phosphotransfer) domain-containing protein